MGFLDGLFTASSWSVESVDKLPKAEVKQIKSATIVPAEYGNMMCLLMHSGERKWAKLIRDTTLVEGDDVDPSSITVTILSKPGEENIVRFDGEAIE